MHLSQELETQLLELSAIERARLAVALIRSLEGNDHFETWNEQIEHRLSVYHEDPSDVRPSTDVVETLRNRSRK